MVNRHLAILMCIPEDKPMPLKWIHNRIERFYAPFSVPFDDAEFYSVLHDLASHYYVNVIGSMVVKTNIGDEAMDEMVEELARSAESMDDMFMLMRAYEMFRNGEITIRREYGKMAKDKSEPYWPQFIQKPTSLFEGVEYGT